MEESVAWDEPAILLEEFKTHVPIPLDLVGVDAAPAGNIFAGIRHAVEGPEVHHLLLPFPVPDSPYVVGAPMNVFRAFLSETLLIPDVQLSHLSAS